MPEFEKSKGFRLKSGNDPSFKMMGSLPMKKKGDTEPEKGNYRDPKGKVLPGELRSQALAREARGHMLSDTMDKIKPGKLISPERHAKSDAVKKGMATTGIKDPKVFDTTGQISGHSKYAGPTATRTTRPDARFANALDKTLDERTIKGSKKPLPAPKTKKQKRQNKRAAKKNK